MLTSVQAAHARRFTASPHGGFSAPAVDELRARVAATLASYEGTGTPGRHGLTADELNHVVLPSVIAQPGYALLEVQDFLDEALEALSAFEQRAHRPAPAAAPSAPASWAPQGTWVPQEAAPVPAPNAHVPAERPAPSRPLPRNVTAAIRARAAVGAASRPDTLPPSQSVAPRPLPTAPAAPAPVGPWPGAPSPVSAPARAYGMDADALLFELQQVIAQSRARGSLQVSVQVPGQQLRVLRVVESAPGTVTIVAQ